MDAERTFAPVWEERKPIIYRRGDTYKTYLPEFLERIRKHYGSSFGSSSAHGNGNRFRELLTTDYHRRSVDKDWTTTILKISPSVVSVSIFLGVQRKVDCTGLVIHWDELTSTATVLASAKLLRIPEEESRDDYYIVVRLPNGIILLAEDDYVDHYRNIMTLKVRSDFEIKPVKLSSVEIEEGTEVVAVARNFYTGSLSESRGKIHKDFPCFGCHQLLSSTCSGSQDDEGGPSITRTGQVCGINLFDGRTSYHHLPTVVVNSCLEKWKFHSVDVQPWFGLSVIDIPKLPLDALEALAAMGLNVTTGAVIKQVYEGSPADEVGVCPGDLVTEVMCTESIDIFSASQYSAQLSRMSGFLSDCTRGSLHPAGTFAVKLRENASGKIKIVPAENLSVDDRRFCCSWPGDVYDLFRNRVPLLGSQTESGFDIVFNDNLRGWSWN